MIAEVLIKILNFFIYIKSLNPVDGNLYCYYKIHQLLLKRSLDYLTLLDMIYPLHICMVNLVIEHPINMIRKYSQQS